MQTMESTYFWRHQRQPSCLFEHLPGYCKDCWASKFWPKKGLQLLAEPKFDFEIWISVWPNVTSVFCLRLVIVARKQDVEAPLFKKGIVSWPAPAKFCLCKFSLKVLSVPGTFVYMCESWLPLSLCRAGQVTVATRQEKRWRNFAMIWWNFYHTDTQILMLTHASTMLYKWHQVHMHLKRKDTFFSNCISISWYFYLLWALKMPDVTKAALKLGLCY